MLRCPKCDGALETDGADGMLPVRCPHCGEKLLGRIK